VSPGGSDEIGERVESEAFAGAGERLVDRLAGRFLDQRPELAPELRRVEGRREAGDGVGRDRLQSLFGHGFPTERRGQGLRVGRPAPEGVARETSVDEPRAAMGYVRIARQEARGEGRERRDCFGRQRHIARGERPRPALDAEVGLVDRRAVARRDVRPPVPEALVAAE
jgi:hypothetical protein